jgi:hypothetical protein
MTIKHSSNKLSTISIKIKTTISILINIISIPIIISIPPKYPKKELYLKTNTLNKINQLNHKIFSKINKYNL